MPHGSDGRPAVGICTDAVTANRRVRIRIILLGMTMLSLSAANVQAARPMITDDARVVDAKACQVESWVKKTRDTKEYWALPGCNFTGNLEVTLGGAVERSDTGTHTTDIVLQAKTLFKVLEPNGWGLGLAMGNVRRPQVHNDASVVGDLYAYVPASFSFRDDRTVLHTNLGWLREKEGSRHRLTWGIGVETQLADRTWLIAESFDNDSGRAFYQFGVRQWLIPNRIQVDVTYGNRFTSGSDERWISLGVRLLSPTFLP